MELEQHLVDRFRLFYLVTSLESDLRGLLGEWVAPFVEETTLFGDDLLERVRERRQDDGRADEGASLLDYLDFSDAYLLLNKFRQMLPPEVGQAVRGFTPQLEPLVQPRNRVMHSRPLQDGDLEAVARVCSAFVDTRLELPTLRLAVRRIQSDPTWIPELRATGIPDRVLNNLPLPEFDETTLIGRQKENNELLRRLQMGRDPIVTVVGEGGIGKTALVVKSLYDLIDDAKCPYEAVLWASLKTERLTGRSVEEIEDAARSMFDVAGIWADLLELAEDRNVDVLADALEGIPTLLVLDNLETTSGQEVVDFYDRLPRDCRILATSRIGVGQLERRMPLEPLAAPAAAKLLRQYARKRSVNQLATLEEAAVVRQVERLRRLPLAIRWFVEAVEAGADPSQLLRGQEDLLRFCLETIYEGLGDVPRQVLAVLHASGRDLSVADLSVIMEKEPDAVRRSLMELGRRSLVVARLGGAEGTHEHFRLASSAELYLRNLVRPSDEVVREASEREKRLRQDRERATVQARSNPLSPNVVDDMDGEQAAVAHLLASALRLNRSRSRPEAFQEAERARQLAPEYYEVHRVLGFMHSRSQPEAATQRYEDALRFAPNERAAGRVAYFYAEHLIHVEHEVDRAEAMARQAHDAWRAPATAERLGRILTYCRNWSEAEGLLRFAIADDDPRVSVIARTGLVSLARRRTEAVARDERNPMAAIESGWRDLKEAWAYFATGHVDDTLQDAALDLGCEVVRSADGLESVSTAASILHEVVAGLAARRVQLQTSRHYRAALRALRQLHLRSDLPPDLRAVTDDALGLLASTAAASHVGRIKRFSRARRWGFITCDDHEYFFHVSELQSPDEAIFLVEGLPVEFNVGEGREGRPQAEDVRPAPATDEGVLFKRRARVEAIKQHYCFAIDEQTEATVFVSKAAFENRRAFDGLAVGDILLADYELGGEGPRAKRESARVVRPAEWDHQRFR